MLLWDLFFTFAKIGLFTFGGGYAMLAVFEDVCCEKKGWATHEDMMNMTVIAESTPGPIAINFATFVGYKQKGIIGAIASTFGMVLPSFIVIFVIAMVLDNFLEITIIANAFKGIQCAVGLIIINAAINMIKKMKKTKLTVAITVATFALMMLINVLSIKFSSIVLMFAGGLLCLIVYIIRESKEKEAK